MTNLFRLLSFALILSFSSQASAHGSHGDGAEYYQMAYGYSTNEGEHPDWGQFGDIYYHGSSPQEVCEDGVDVFERVASEVEFEYFDFYQGVNDLTGRINERSGRCFYSHVEYTGERVPYPNYLSFDWICQRLDGDGNLESYRWCPPEPPRTCPVQSEHPIQFVDGRKVLNAVDWVSSVDPRFGLTRNYNSNLTGDYLLPTGFGIGWGSSLFATSSIVGTGTNYVNFGDGTTENFFRWAWYWNREPVARTKDLNLWFNASVGPNSEDIVGFQDGRKWLFRTLPLSASVVDGPRALTEMQWPDGYRIFLTYDESTQLIEVMYDNRGQRAELTWEITSDLAPMVEGVALFNGALSPDAAVSRAPNAALKTVLIDTDYDSTTFMPEVRVDYAYSAPVYYHSDDSRTTIRRGINLERALTTDLEGGRILSDLRYQYDIVDRRLLTRISDQRTNEAGSAFDALIFEYENMSILLGDTDVNGDRVLNVTRAVTSGHHGGAERTDVSAPSFASGENQVLERPYDVSVTNSLGKETVYTFERVAGRHRVVNVEGVSTASCIPSNSAIMYDENGRVLERIEKNGSRSVMTRDGYGRILTLTEDADGLAPHLTTYTWPSTYRSRKPLTRTTSELQEAFVYDADGLLTSYSQTDVLAGSADNGKVRTWTYNYTTLTSGLKVLTSLDGPGLAADGVNDITTYTYNERGQLLTTTDASGYITEVLSYGPSGQPTLIRDFRGFEWALDYDMAGRLLSSTFEPGILDEVTTYSYDIIGQMLSSTDSLGRTWSYTYDEARRLTQITAPSGETINFDHDAMGNVTRTEYTDTAAIMTYLQETQYDELGRVLQAIGANGQTTDYSHDVEDNLATVTDATSLTTSMSYDALNRMTDIVDRANYTTLMDHDDSGQMTSYTDPRGIETGFAFNGFGEVISETSADRGTMTYVHDNRGLVIQATDGRGIVTNYTYDNGGRITSKTFPSDPSLDQTFAYREDTSAPYNLGALLYANDQSGQTRWVNETARGDFYMDRRFLGDAEYRVYYFQNEAREVYRVRYPSGSNARFEYDEDGDLRRVLWLQMDSDTGEVEPTQIVTREMTYKPMGPLSSLIYGDGGTHAATYDTSYRLTGLVDMRSGTALRDVSYGWTNRDNLETVTDNLNPAQSETYDYSPREFLASGDGAWGELDWQYDGVGNRTQQMSYAAGATTTDIYGYPADSNRLTDIVSSTGSTRSLTYDAAGNVTFDNRNGPGYSYTYDASGRMSSFAINGVVQAEYEYNFLGQQVIRRLTQTGETIHSVHDAAGNRIAEYLYDESAGTSSLIREYIWADAKLLGVVENGTLYYVRTDHIGRPVFATDGAGAKVWEASYLPFGGLQASSGPNSTLRFPGQWFQSETGLHQNWMRDYDPTTGRYIQADPLGLVDGASVYGYVTQNPGRYVDPRGERRTMATPRPPLTRPSPPRTTPKPHRPPVGVPSSDPMAYWPQHEPPYEASTTQCTTRDCLDIYWRISEAVREMNRRFTQQAANKNNLTFIGHAEAILGYQRYLRDLLDEARARGCLLFNQRAHYYAWARPPAPGWRMPPHLRGNSQGRPANRQ